MQDTLYGTMSFGEAARLVLAVLCAASAVWGYLHVKDGKNAFDQAIQARMIYRRREQMVIAFLIAVVLGGEAGIAASMPTSPSATSAVTYVNGAAIIALALLMFTTLRQIGGWAYFEEVIGSRHLIQAPSERLAEQVSVGRRLSHQLAEDMSIPMNVLDLLNENPTVVSRDDIIRALQSLSNAASTMSTLHGLIRGIVPEGPESLEGDQEVAPKSQTGES